LASVVVELDSYALFTLEQYGTSSVNIEATTTADAILESDSSAVATIDISANAECISEEYEALECDAVISMSVSASNIVIRTLNADITTDTLATGDYGLAMLKESDISIISTATVSAIVDKFLESELTMALISTSVSTLNKLFSDQWTTPGPGVSSFRHKRIPFSPDVNLPPRRSSTRDVSVPNRRFRMRSLNK